MSSFQARPSIMLRPRKDASASMSNTQHLDMEHDKELARLSAKRESRAAREHDRGQAMWGDAAAKADIASKLSSDYSRQIEARRAIAHDEADSNARLQQDMSARDHAGRRQEAQSVEAKREYLTRLREENYQLAERRKAHSQHQREEEIAIAAQSQGSTILDRFGRHAF